VTADLAIPEVATLESTVAGADAVLSGLGARSMAEVGVAAQGTRAIVHAMQATGVRLIVVVSAAPVSTTSTTIFASQTGKVNVLKGSTNEENNRSSAGVG